MGLDSYHSLDTEPDTVQYFEIEQVFYAVSKDETDKKSVYFFNDKEQQWKKISEDKTQKTLGDIFDKGVPIENIINFRKKHPIPELKNF